MRQIRRALVRPHDRWSVFFTKLGEHVDADDIYGPRYFRLPGLDVFCKLAPGVTPGVDLPTLEERIKARKLGVSLKSKVILLTGNPDNLAMRNLMFIPPQTPEEQERDSNPMYLSRGQQYNGWYLGNFSDRHDKGVEFKRLGHDPVYLGRSSGLTVFDAFIASMNLFME